MEVKLYNQKGEEVGKVKLSDKVFSLPWNPDLVHQVAVSMEANKRKPVAHVKDRSEVRGGGRKPWRQKGTGRARHGSIRSPIWVGGGVTHGPTKEKIFLKKINKKMKKKALYTILSQKIRDKELLVLDKIELREIKTKEAAQIVFSLSKISGFEKLRSKKKNCVLILIKDNEEIKRAFRNLPGVLVAKASNLNVLSALTYKYLIFLKESLAILN